jgi:hypothetical protein
LLLEKSADMSNNKDKKKPISRSSRAGLQVCFLSIVGHMCVWMCTCMYVCECVSQSLSLLPGPTTSIKQILLWFLLLCVCT